MIPRGRALVPEEEVEQLVRALAPSEAHERRDIAQLVRCVDVPGGAAVAPRSELFPVALERRPHELLWQITRAGSRCESDRRRRRVEVAELDGAGQVVDAVKLGRRAQRRGEIGAELVARGGEPAFVVRAAERVGDRDDAVVALERPEIVPVRMHGLGGIAFVADRGGQHPEIRIARAVVRRMHALALPQAFEVIGGGLQPRP